MFQLLSLCYNLLFHSPLQHLNKNDLIIRQATEKDIKEIHTLFAWGQETLVPESCKAQLRAPHSLILYSLCITLFVWLPQYRIQVIFFLLTCIAALIRYGVHVVDDYTVTNIAADLSEIESYYLKRQGCNFWVVEYNSQIVGMVAADRKSEEIIELRRMSVHHQMRRYGIATLLVQKLEEFAQENNYKFIVLGTSSMQTPAHRMYEKCGFRCTADDFQWKWGFSLMTFEKTIVQ